MPAIPARSYSTTVRTTFDRPPKPLSQSARTGRSVAPSIRTAAARASVIVVRFRSGNAWAMVATAKPLTHTASKPYAPMSWELMASCAPTATNGFSDSRPARRAARFLSARLLRITYLFRWWTRTNGCGWASGCRCGHHLVGRQELVEGAPLVGAEQLHDALADEPLGVQRHRTDVRGEDDVRQRPQGRDDPLALVLVDVERRAQDAVALGELRVERVLAPAPAASHVHEEGAVLHVRQDPGVDDVVGLLSERQVQAEEVGLPHHGVEVGEGHAALGQCIGHGGRGPVHAPDGAHAPRSAHLAHPAADAPGADDAEGLPRQQGTAELSLGPVPLAEEA